VHSLIAQGPSGAWNSGAAVLTCFFPALLFIAVAGALYILYTKPEVAPGHKAPERPISYTAIPGQPATDQPATEVSGAPAADRGETSVADDETGAAESENVAESENTEAKGDE
jgi:hypothetical protein